MRIFYSFLIIMCSAILILLPVTAGVYAFRTDQRTDTFTVATDVGSSNATVQLLKSIYDNDTSTIEISSYNADDIPFVSSYNTTTRALAMTGFSGNATRAVDVAYDIDALGASAAISNFLDYLPWVWILVWIAFPVGGLAAIWIGRAG